MISFQLADWPQYCSGAAWQDCFHFLETLSPMSAPEDYISLRSDAIFARIMRYPTRPREDAIIEAHRKYIDVQMSLLHSEGIRWFDPATLRVKTPYSDKADAEFYEIDAPVLGEVANHPGVVTILFPEDPHMPQLTLDGTRAEVLKVVVKVRVDLVR